MGVGRSRSSSAASGEEYVDHGCPKLRINTCDLLNGIFKKCQTWIDIINNIKQSKLPDEDAQAYIFQELKETKEEIDIVVVSLDYFLLVILNHLSRMKQVYGRYKTIRQ